jgi:hypothetical protein
MNEMNTQTTEEKEKRPVQHEDAEDEKGTNVGWGIFLILAGIALFAKEIGWLPFKINWLVPAILVAIGVGFLYDSFKKK